MPGDDTRTWACLHRHRARIPAIRRNRLQCSSCASRPCPERERVWERELWGSRSAICIAARPLSPTLSPHMGRGR
ncbi:MAG: hypothetical protein ACTS6G_05975 [Candidatus Hodgkinia cicadicola]